MMHDLRLWMGACFGAILVLLILIQMPNASASDLPALLQATDQFDQMDKMDFDDNLKKTGRCTLARDFACGDSALKQARKFAHTERDKTALARAEGELRTEKLKAEEEARLLIERERELQVAESRLREAEEEAERQANSFEPTNGSMSGGEAVALFGSLLNQSLRNQAMIRAGEAQRSRQLAQNQAQVQADLQRQQQRFARERSELESRRAELQRQQVSLQNARSQEMAGRSQQAQRDQATQASAQQAEQQAAQRQRDDAIRAASEQRVQALMPRAVATGSVGSGTGGPDSRIAQLGAQLAGVNLAELNRDSGDSASSASASGGSSSNTNVHTAPRTSRPDDAQAADEDGCLEAIGWCATPPEVSQHGSETRALLRNTCPFRVYATVSIGRADGTVDAGAEGVRAGGSHKFYAYNGNGRVFSRIVGSAKGSKDWVCRSKLAGFAVGDATLERPKR